jgi:multiple sugar transport system ATP-binding protein
MASVGLRSISKRFGATAAVDSLDVTIADGEFFVLLGPSGAGKTTTLRLVAGLEQPDAGAVLLDGVDVTAWQAAGRDVAFVFQQYSLYPHLTVYDNLAFPLRAPVRRVPQAQIKQRVHAIAEKLHLENKLARKATQLSGGEMQRVAIGRALVRQPRVFLMDEPLSSLDAKLREEMRVELKRLQRELGATVLYVTHDQIEAATLADRIGVLDRGRLRQIGAPQQIYDDPRALDVAQRLGTPAVNVLPRVWFDGDAAPADAAHVAVRPEDVRINGAGAPFRVVECSLLKHQLVAERDGIEVRVTALLEHPYASGDAIRLEFPPAQRLYFAADGRRIDQPIAKAS